MADLSALPTDTIKSLEQALTAFGVEGITVDGDASDLGEAQVVELLDKLSRALGDDGISFGGGDSVTLEDFRDPVKRAEILARVQTSVEGFRDSPHMKLFGEILKGKDGASSELIAKHVSDMGITGPIAAAIPAMAIGFLHSAETPIAAASQLLAMATGQSDDLQKIQEILGPNVLGHIDQTIALLENSNDWFEVVSAIGGASADVAPPPSEPVVVAPVVVPEEEVSPLPSEPVVVAPLDPIATAIANVEFGLKILVPVVQAELDKKRGEAQALINQIDGQVSTEEFDRLYRERQALIERLEEMPEEKVLERATMSGKIQILTGQMSGGDSNIAQFIDNFLLTTVDSDLGRRMVETGRNWAGNAVRSRLVGIHDIPEPGAIGDGVLDMHDQAALQGTLFLLATNFNLRVDDKWRYRPELGKLLIEKLDKSSFEDQEMLVLGFMEQANDAADLAAYETMDTAQKTVFLKQKMAENKGQITLFITSLDTLYAAGLLVDKQLYSSRPLEIAPFVQNIFHEYIKTGNDQISAAHVGLLNGLVNEFTEGIGLQDAVGKGFGLPSGMKAIAGNMTQLFQDAFDDVGATSVADFESKLDKDHMLSMIETLPFGSVDRREAFKGAVNKAFDAARQAEAANEDDAVNIAVLVSAAFGQSLEGSMSAINADPKMHSEYLFSSDRPVLMHPDLADKSFEIEDGSSMDAQSVFDVYKRINNGFESRDVPGAPLEEIDHKPLYFKDENGEIYIAMIDAQSYVLDIQPLNIDVLEQAIKDGVGYDGLVEISPGYGLAFQDMGDNPPWNIGTSMGPGDFVENVRMSTWRLADFRAPVSAAPAVVPESRSGVGGEFENAVTPEVQGDAGSGVDDFRANGNDILAPAVPDVATGEPAPVVRQNPGGR